MRACSVTIVVDREEISENPSTSQEITVFFMQVAVSAKSFIVCIMRQVYPNKLCQIHIFFRPQLGL